MADARITELAVITGADVDASDPLVIVDLSDTDMAPTGTDKKLSAGELALAMQSLIPGVVLAPGTSDRNVIQATADATELTLKADTEQTAPALSVLDSDGNVLFTIDPATGATQDIRASFPFILQNITLDFEDDTITYPWMIFAQDEPVIAWGIAGDSFPRVCLIADPEEGWYFGDGTFDAYTDGGAAFSIDRSEPPSISFSSGHSDANPNRASMTFAAGSDGGGSGTVTVLGAIQAFTEHQSGIGGDLLIGGTLQVQGPLISGANIEPDDSLLANSQHTTWLDDTPGAVVLHVKAKDSLGGVYTASIPMTPA